MSARLDRIRRLQLRDVAVDRVEFDLQVDGRYERRVSAVVDAGGNLRFPHIWSDAGESLGNDAADAFVLEEARTELVRLNAALRGRAQRR